MTSPSRLVSNGRRGASSVPANNGNGNGNGNRNLEHEGKIAARFRNFFGQDSNGDAADAEDEQQTMAIVPVETPPTNFAAIQDEKMLNGIISAYASLKFSSIQLHLSGGQTPSSLDLWTSLMGNFELAVEMGIDYLGLLPGVSAMKPSDRRLIFSESLLPMAVVQQIVDCPQIADDGKAVPGDFFFLNMAPQARTLFLSYFPFYQTLAKEIFEVGIALANWAPSPVELAFVEAFLFYNTDVAGLKNRAAVEYFRGALLRVVKAYLKASYTSDEQAASAVQHLQLVCNLLTRLPQVHTSVIGQMFTRHPETATATPLLSKVYPRGHVFSDKTTVDAAFGE